MRKWVNLLLGLLSLGLGMALMAQAIRAGGLGLGLIFGLVLLANGAFRLWLARQAGKAG